MRRFLFLLPVFAACGCAPRSVFLIDALVTGAALARASESADAERRARQPEDDPAPPDLIVVIPPGPPSAIDLQPPLPPTPATKSFDLAAAYAALDGADVSSCKDAGLATGYGRVVVGFAPDGSVRGVAVALPYGSSTDALECVGRAFGAARVAPFSGTQPVNVRREFFVR